MSDLINATEFCLILGVSAAKFYAIKVACVEDFPAPVSNKRNAHLWTRQDAEAFAALWNAKRAKAEAKQ